MKHVLDAQLTFEEYLNLVTTKTNKTIRLLQKLQNILSRLALNSIYKAFVRQHLDYGDVIYDEAYNKSFHQKLESVQYNDCLALPFQSNTNKKIRTIIPEIQINLLYFMLIIT